MNEAKIMITIKKVRGDIVKFDEILRNIHTEGLIGVGLIIALFLAIYFNDRDLAVNIASGLIGYLGRGKVAKE